MADTSVTQNIGTTGALVSNTSASTQVGLLSTPGFNHMITVKLTGENYLLWTAQLFPYLRSQRLTGYIDGTNVHPASTITQSGTDGITRPVANPEFNNWYQ